MAERDEFLAAFDTALAALEHGASLESVLAADPARAAQLRPLLLAALAAGAGADWPRVPVGAQASSRSQFLAGAAERRAALAPIRPARRGQRAGSGVWLGANWLARALATALMVAGALGLGGYGAVAASAQSLPGDPLYGVKRSVEQTELLLATTNAARTQLQTEFDDRRVREAQAVASAGRQVAVDFTGTLISMDGLQGQQWLVSGVAVLVEPQVPVTGTPQLGRRVRIEGAVQAAGLVQAQRVTVLPIETPTASATPAPTSTATPTAMPAVDQATAQPSDTAAPTDLAPIATQEPAASATPTASPVPQSTEAASATDDHGGGPGPSATNTPEPTDGGGPGPSASNTPEATDDGGGGGPGPSASQTPRPSETDDDHVGSQTPAPTDDPGGGPSPSNTPKPTSGGGGGASPSNTPRPTDDDGGGSGGGPSPSNTPKPGD